MKRLSLKQGSRGRAQDWLGRSVHGVLRDSFHRFAVSTAWPPPHGSLGWLGHWLSQPHSTELDGEGTERTSCLAFWRRFLGGSIQQLCSHHQQWRLENDVFWLGHWVPSLKPGVPEAGEVPFRENQHSPSVFFTLWFCFHIPFCQVTPSESSSITDSTAWSQEVSGWPELTRALVVSLVSYSTNTPAAPGCATTL